MMSALEMQGQPLFPPFPPLLLACWASRSSGMRGVALQPLAGHAPLFVQEP